MSTVPEKRILYAFDFDHTIVNENSDTFINQLLLDKVLTPSVRSTYDGTNWTEFMNNVFTLHHQQEVSIQQILDCIKQMTLTPGILTKKS